MRLGQHILLDESIASKMVEIAEIKPDDVIFEIGSGTGVLTRELCKRAKRVISCEIDRYMYEQASSIRYNNLELYNIDGFEYAYAIEFDKFVANLPYSRSKDTIEMLAIKHFEVAVVMLQKEFVEKILRGKRAISFIAKHCFNIEHILDVDRYSFRPIPMVDSSIVRLRKKNTLTHDKIVAIKLLFSLKGRRVRHASDLLHIKIDHSLGLKRVEDLNEEELLAIIGG